MHWQAVPVLTGVVPLAYAWWQMRRSALVHSLTWALGAWCAWVWQAATWSATARYVAVAATACAGVAVYGARRPNAAAWNGVVVGLFALLLVPLGQNLLLDAGHAVEAVWLWLLAIMVVIVCINFIPTSLYIPALGLFLLCCVQLLYHERGPDRAAAGIVELAGAFVPWAAWLSLYRQRCQPVDPHGIWLSFRDRFGAVWGLRVREQFNAAATHAGWKIELGWSGFRAEQLRELTEVERLELQRVLVALLQRFGWP